MSADTVTIAARVPLEVRAEVDAVCKAEGRTASAVLSDAVQLWLRFHANGNAVALNGDGTTHALPASGEASGATGNRALRRMEVLALFAKAGQRGHTSPEIVELLPDRPANATPRRVQDLLERGHVAELAPGPTTSNGHRYLPEAVFGPNVVRDPRTGEEWREDPKAIGVRVFRRSRHGKLAKVYAITPIGRAAIAAYKLENSQP